jgi:hypothetical protein
MLTILLFLFGTIPTDSTPKYEQLTTDYFFNTIWEQKYQDYKSIEFVSQTDTSLYVGHVYGCKQWTEPDKKHIQKGSKNKPVNISAESAYISIKRRSNSKRLKLTIGTRIQLGDTYVVPITVYKPFEFVDHYFIKFDQQGQVIDKCEVNEII